jgi:predicted DNA-binding transcriptional regulator YafY
MFNENEIEALLLGARIVQSWPTLNSLRLRLRQR